MQSLLELFLECRVDHSMSLNATYAVKCIRNDFDGEVGFGGACTLDAGVSAVQARVVCDEQFGGGECCRKFFGY